MAIADYSSHFSLKQICPAVVSKTCLQGKLWLVPNWQTGPQQLRIDPSGQTPQGNANNLSSMQTIANRMWISLTKQKSGD